MHNIQIRPLLPGEAAPMSLLLLADPFTEAIQSYIDRGQCYVAEAHGRLIGVYVLLHTRPHTVELINIAVDEAVQGKGIGKQLILHAIQTACHEGYKTMEVGTGNSSIGQLALYQKCGFRIIGVDFDFFTSHYPDPIYENGILCRDMIRLAMQL